MRDDKHSAKLPSGTRLWGASWPQRVRLFPFFLATAIADRIAPRVRPPPSHVTPWEPGITIIIPERDAVTLLQEALTALLAALARITEPVQVIVVANGAPRSLYAGLEARYPEVEFVHSDPPLAFAHAIERGLSCARHDWTLLLNNDMTIAESAVAVLAAQRAPDVFGIGAQIFQRSASGRREETGFTDWYVDGDGVHLFHASPATDAITIAHLCASGGAALFRTVPLRQYIHASRAYDPFYWEDVEWSLRAWRDGWRVLFAPDAHAHHQHRATTARFHDPAELARIVERNRLLFDARHAITPETRSTLMNRLCDLPYASQRELARIPVAYGVLRQRLNAFRPPQPMQPPVLWTRDREPRTLATASYSYRLRTQALPLRPTLLVVTPFAVFPPRHGGARRVAELLRSLRADHDIILVSDEARLYDARSFASFDGLRDVRLVQRENHDAIAASASLDARMANHVHRDLVRTVAAAIKTHQPALIQVEHAEIAGLVSLKSQGQHWILGLHDACGPDEFSAPGAFDRFERETLCAYDAVTVCSEEDAALTHHPRVIHVPNGAAVNLGAYQPSTAMQLLFIGPFRYGPNRAGITQFLRDAYPAIRAALPQVSLRILGGDAATAIARTEIAFAQPGVEVLGHRDDVPALLDACTLTVNPLTGIRGSAVKLIESLMAGRICVSTEDGARGFHGAGFAGLVTVPDVAAMADPIVHLLHDATERHRREVPVIDRLRPYQWDACADRQRDVYASLLHGITPHCAHAE